ncbi:Beta-galactosidase, domain 2 [Granulicella rosea]|uniref:Beta-galactosidase n=1 Tax=Granulicella rosea TaxID=474952 RepID=A0A239DT99_9BACT|nr:beta-galactosidase [Granulicella rosea]SNS35730.1 Beta-galactosidase, domain 2 [Granulicella rosea]
MNTLPRALRLYLAALTLATIPACAQNTISIDATAPVPRPQPVQARLGTAKNPAGDVIGVNSQYLTFNGRPWTPVMGEFHFSRYPESQWEQEILKMKAAGVQVVSTYIIWIHHEQTEGQFNWSGQRDLRRFVELCGKHGMYVYPRIGPWAHAEVRNGGLPDWVLKAGPTRQNNPVYLKEVQSFYLQIAAQLRGKLWKDGGPVIGLQVENEYRGSGPGKGDEHIRTLKQMAIADGLDVPLYTVTGWDGAAIPLDSVLPVFGGYPDAPWGDSPHSLPANEVYAFRFTNRSAGSMGMLGGHGQSAAEKYRGTPFFTAEVGDGIEDTYFRRPVVSADDVAAIAPIMLGSGANLLGYYMFHGGRNPEGGDITLQESQITGYPTDLPVKSYDFQAPLGEYGQVRESLRKLKLVHYFLADFGASLAPMTPRMPDKVPANPQDAGVPRVSARTNGEQGFVFVSNYVRGLAMPERAGFQIALKLPSGELRIPETPIDLSAGAYGIWPVNLPVGGATLRYSTAQLFKRVQTGGETYLFFFAIPGIRPEFAFPAGTQVTTTSAAVEKKHTAALERLILPDGGTAELGLGGHMHLVLLPGSQAENVWRVDDPSLLLSTSADAFSDGSQWTLDSTGDPAFELGVFGSKLSPKGEAVAQPETDPLFHRYRATLPAVTLTAKATQIHPAGTLNPPKTGPTVAWRKRSLPLAPDDKDFEQAGAWKLELSPIPADSHVADAFLTLDYQGDVARLYRGGTLVDDNFWNGQPWSVGLREVDPAWRTAAHSFELRILPLPKSPGIFLEDAARAQFNPDAPSSVLRGVSLTPRYRLNLQAPGSAPHP